MHGEANNVLESLHQGSVPCTELMLALLGSVVGDQEGKTALSFSVQKLLFKPGKLMARVLSLSPDVPVETVAGLSVVCNDAGSLWHRLAIEQLDGLAVVSILAKLFIGLWSQPVLPHLLEVVDFVVDTRGSE